MRIKLTVAYDGTAYCGWQLQPGMPTIEGELNKALSDLLGKPARVTGASRTDAGVHALGNVAVFDTDLRIPPEKYLYALNSRLPDDIAVQKSEEARADFHPRRAACKKTYEYTILNRRTPLPEYRNTAYFYYGSLDVKKMKTAAKAFCGEHDFAGFCSSGSQSKTTVRTIYGLSVNEKPLDTDSFDGRLLECGRKIIMRIQGNGFLYNMVRIIAGTLIEVGRGAIPSESMEELINSRDRKRAGATAPAKGLRLIEIRYL